MLVLVLVLKTVVLLAWNCSSKKVRCAGVLELTLLREVMTSRTSGAAMLVSPQVINSSRVSWMNMYWAWGGRGGLGLRLYHPN